MKLKKKKKAGKDLGEEYSRQKEQSIRRESIGVFEKC